MGEVRKVGMAMSQRQGEGAAQVPPDGRIVVVGGYGAIGRVVARTLAGWFPGQVVVAGRDPRRAEAVAWSMLVFGLRAAGVFSLLGRLGAAPLLTSGFSRLHLGGDRYVVHAAATNGRHTVESATAGRQQGHATGIVTAQVARRLHTGKAPTGVLHIDQLVEPAAFFDDLQAHGILVTHGERLADPIGHARA
jgi:hypothetical protein